MKYPQLRALAGVLPASIVVLALAGVRADGAPESRVEGHDYVFTRYAQ